MKNIKTRCIQLIKKLFEKYPGQCVSFAVLFAVVFFAFHNSFLYSTSVGIVTKAETSETGAAANHNSLSENASEPTYTQKLTVKILNGSNKGRRVRINNSFGYSRIDTTKYRKGDRVFLNIKGEKKITSVSITGIKRDQYMVMLTAILVFLIIVLGKRRGIFALISIGVNIAVFYYAVTRYEAGEDLLQLCIVMIAVFTVVTVLLVNGINRRSFVAIIAALITSALTMMIFFAAMNYGAEIDYAALDYAAGGQDLERIFIASIAIAGLGAMMDVAVSITSALNELIAKNPDIGIGSLLRSGRELGYDIMGTMINVLLFTYVCGLFPIMIIKMQNDVRLFTIIRLQIPFEICRFLIGGIGIVLAIPVSIVLSSTLLKIGRKRR